MRLPRSFGARIVFVVAAAVLPALAAWLIGQAWCVPAEHAAALDAADTSGARGCWEPVAAAMLLGGLGWLTGWIVLLRQPEPPSPWIPSSFSPIPLKGLLHECHR